MPLRHLARLAGSILAAIALAASPAGAQHPNVRVSGSPSGAPEEVMVTIDPTNPLRLGAGANIDWRYSSFDGGLTWTEGFMTSSLGVAGDPVVTHDAEGRLYYAHLSDPGDWLDRIVVQRSTDGGLVWNDGVGVGLDPPRDQDKPGLLADLTGSPFHDNLYLAWTEFDAYGSPDPADSTRILFSRSTDHGLTWSAASRISDLGGDCIDGDQTVEGAIPAVGPNGEVYLAWSGPGGIRLDRSFDGGATFGSDVLVATQPGGWDFGVPGLGRSNGLPTTLCDVSASPRRGRVYVVWSDQRAGEDDTDILLSRSTDEGQTWSAPVRVNGDATTTHQFFPAATIDPTTGILYVAYYDRSATMGSATDVYVSRSADGGETFQSLRVSDASFTPRSTVFFGDYIGVAARDRKVHTIWMRMDATHLSIWTAQWSDTGAVLGVPGPATPQVVALRAAVPNPFRSSTRLGYALASAGRVEIRVLDVQGRLVETLLDAEQPAGEHRIAWDARAHPAGLYLIALTSRGVTRVDKLILVR